MTLLRPGGRLVIDGRPLTMPEAAAVSIEVLLQATGGHDHARVVLGPLSPWADQSAGSTATVAIGAADDVTAVLAGTIDRVRHLPWATVLDVVGPTAPLGRARAARAYTSMSVGDIARDLLATAGARPGEVESGPTLGAYHVDEQRTCWQQLRALAALFGYEIAAGAQGEVHVRPPRQGAADHTLRAGAELTDWSVGDRTVGLAAGEVGTFGAASDQGADAWSLVHHEPGGGGFHRILPAVRDREAGSAIDRATRAAHDRTAAAGTVVANGAVAVRAGDLVALDGAADATYRVRRVRHRVDAGGLRSALELEAA